MPSGRAGGSRGGGGSHFGGSRGGRGRSSSGGGTYRSHHVRGLYNGRAVVFIGTRANRRYISDGIYSVITLLGFIAFFLLFSLFGTFMNLNQINGDIKIIEEDFLHYQDMIEDAEYKESQGISGYIIYGTVESRYRSLNSDKWYLTYRFVADDGSIVDNGYTYSTYTWEQVKDISAGDPILLALEYAPSNRYTDSIDMDFKNKTIEDDGDYIALLEEKQSTTGICVTIGIVILGIVVICVVLWKKNSKKVDEEATTSTGTQTYQAPEQPKKNYCRYCGSVVPNGKTSCDNCGAGICSGNDLT